MHIAGAKCASPAACHPPGPAETEPTSGALAGQGANEYLILLAVVLIIAVIGVALLGFFPGMSGDAKAAQSRAYWDTTRPTGVYDAITSAAVCNGSSSGYVMTVQNHGPTPIRLTGISIAGQNSGFCKPGSSPTDGINLEAGEKAVIEVPAGITSSTGKSIIANVSINSTSQYGIASTQFGTIPLVITNGVSFASPGGSCAANPCYSDYFCNSSSACQLLTAISIAAISGVTAPVAGAAPSSAITASAQYTGSVSWSPTSNPFACGTAYTATIAITPKAGYTLTGVPANFFTVSGATASNPADSGAVAAVFPATAQAISISAIAGVTAPVAGAIPVAAITETAQYTGAVTWLPANNPFTALAVYTASINITPKANYTLSCVAANFFTVDGATATNPANSGNVTAVFPATSCNTGMAYITKLGGYCIDRYEASNGGGGKAASQVGAVPWVSISMYGAQTACIAAGKYLCTDAQWLGAADIQGAYYNLPTNLGNAPYNCVVNSGAAALTGSQVGCRSSYLVYDMTGNVWEWTNGTVSTVAPSPGTEGWYYPTDAGWITTQTDTKYGYDGVYFYPGTQSGRAVIRGGGWGNGAYAGPFYADLYNVPSDTGSSVGFRCCSGSNLGSGISTISSVSDAYAGFSSIN